MIHLERPYDCPDEEALARMQELAAYWHDKHGLSVTWDGPRAHLTGRVKGVSFDARVSVESGRVRADVKAGFLAEKLGGRQYVERKIATYMDPDVSLEALRAKR